MDSVTPSIKNVSVEAQNMLETFWKREMVSIQKTNNNEFKNQELPLARIKKIMKLDEDVKMISGEAPVLFAKAVEIFISELSLRAWINTEENKRRTLQRNDIAAAIGRYDQFDFLIDIVPRDETKPKKSDHSNSSITQEQYFVQIAQQQPLSSTGAGQSIHLLQTPNQTQQFSIPPQIIQVPVPSSTTRNQDNSTLISPQMVNINQTSNSQVQLPLTLSSPQYQTLISSNQQGHSSHNQPILVNQPVSMPAQYITTNPGQVVQISPNSSTSNPSNASRSKQSR